jgi:hypothetical protein
MGKLNVRAAAAGGGDANWSNVVLLASFDGTNGATAFVDESPALHGAATFRGTAALSNTRSKFGATALYTGASGSVYWPDSPDWDFGAGDFTVEFWLWVRAYGGGNSFFVAQWDGSSGERSWAAWANPNTKFSNATSSGGFNDDITYSGGEAVDTAWHHVAASRSGGKTRWRWNGNMVASSVVARTYYNSTANLSVGMDSGGVNYPGNFDMSELRITKGVDRYPTDSAIVVPTAKFPRG